MSFNGQSSRQTNAETEEMCGIDARPHPGPLPEERENRPPLFGETDVSGDRACLGANVRQTVTANTTTEFPNAAASFPLSLGERDGVRASVTTDFPPSRITHHASRI